MAPFASVHIVYPRTQLHCARRAHEPTPIRAITSQGNRALALGVVEEVQRMRQHL